VVRERYADQKSVDALFSSMGPAGRRLRLSHEPDRGQPVMLTEFGGIKYAPHTEYLDAWGYSTAQSSADFAERLGSLLDAVRMSTVLAGYCYTQLTDTGQETNGILHSDRSPKLPMAQMRAIITGRAVAAVRDTSRTQQGRPEREAESARSQIPAQPLAL
jgi:hypothetical protein